MDSTRITTSTRRHHSDALPRTTVWEIHVSSIVRVARCHGRFLPSA